jgi:hypothetical protein
MQKIFGISVVALLLVSCNQSGGVRSVESTPAPLTTTYTNTPPATSDSAKPVVITSQPALPTLPGANNNVSTVALNPKHGEPGHRCDILVGAPLNSPPGNTVPPTVTNSNPAPVMMNNTQPATQPAALPSNKAVTLNPPHGQPGHDCSVLVGQPLKS